MSNPNIRSARAKRRSRPSSPRYQSDFNQKVQNEKQKQRGGINSPARKRRRAKILELARADKHRKEGSGVLIVPDVNRDSFTSERNLHVAANRRTDSDDFPPVSTPKLKSSLEKDPLSANIINVLSKRNQSSLELVKASSTSTSLKLANSPTRVASPHTKVLATMLPDEVLNDYSGVSPRYYEVVLLFGDVSGFTELCERYDKTGKGGPSRLTEVLNEYLGAMVQIILSKNGDVCKFGGDAILCFWKTSTEMNLMQTTHLAIDSAIDIQKACGYHKTDVGVELRVKTVVSAGEALFSLIGTAARKYYILVGEPILEARKAEGMCKPGDILVSPSAWKHVGNKLLYSYTRHSDDKHIKVHDFGPLWNSVKPSVKANRSSVANIRGVLKSAWNIKMEEIRPFILLPVVRGIDNNERLEYLTEMRQVAIVFIRLVAECPRFEALVSVVDEAYKIVCQIVEGMDGTVNKVTVFDKDVAILVVFGLRGFHYEFSSQLALKCAFDCIQQLNGLPDVQSASAGVTTGMTYCGVVGHVLRREYTVMGMPVNKAARLMCAYERIVSCDRETFLHSKLESGHFELLEQKHLKGIKNVGPVYEFNLSVKKQKVTFDSTSYPLLGRSKEINKLENFFKKSRKNKSRPNVMVIYGDARIGKSRLIAKLIDIVEKKNPVVSDTSLRDAKSEKEETPHLEICFIPLTEVDYKVSYSTMRLIFQPSLGLRETSSVEEREDKIRSKLGETTDVCYLATLNPIFNVNFDLMAQYLAMSPEEQLTAQQLMERRLYNKCFPKHASWLIVIDDAEFIDEKSWPVFQWCVADSQNVWFLLTIGEKKELSPDAAQVLSNIEHEKMTLTEIDKWYHAALACQILGVRAIPVELENAIQGYKNSGNPGWLESYLLTLIQSASLHIAHMTSHEMKKLKLVTPTEDLLIADRHTERERSTMTNWSNCFGSFEEDTRGRSDVLAVCVLGTNFAASTDIEPEVTMDMMYVRTMDSLRPLEQQILKVGSALGYNFKRDALKTVLEKDITIDEKSFGHAIKNLFEVRILGCAKGDLTTPSTCLPSRRMVLNTYLQEDVKCECIGLTKTAECEHLPDYASCGYLRFRSPIFKDTVYNLLLDDQKKKYHSCSIEFLRNNTYKCKSCGSVPFENVFGQLQGNEVRLVCAASAMHGVKSTRMDPQSDFPLPSIKYRLVSCCKRKPASPNACDDRINSDINSFSSVDFSDCQCSQILSSVYAALLDHAEGAGRRDILLEISLEYAALSLTSYNIPHTMRILRESLSLVSLMRDENTYLDYCTPFVFGKIYTLMGATKLSMGRPEKSLELLEDGLKYLGRTFPKSVSTVKCHIRKQNIKRKLTTEFFPDEHIGKAVGRKAALADLTSECLGLICIVHMFTEKWLLARLASVWALNKALESNSNFFGLCTAYTNMMDIAYRENDMQTCCKMEMCAIDLCNKCANRRLEAYELEAVGRLYRVIFKTRHVRAQIEDAISIGFKGIRIASTIRDTTLRLDIIPDLISVLIQVNRLSEAVSLLQELEFAALQDSDKSSRTWYYAISLDFQLDTGFTVIPFKTCEEYFEEQEDSSTAARDPNAQQRLCTSLWLWCVRNEDWEGAKSYAKILKQQNINHHRETPSSVMTTLKRLEGLLISLVNKIENRDINAISSIYSDVHDIMKKLERDTKVVTLLKPRYLLMKAYYQHIRYHDKSSFKILNQAKILADEIKDRNTSDWIIHTKTVWNNTISPIQRDYWREHCRYNPMDWHEADTNARAETFMYSLPLSKYF